MDYCKTLENHENLEFYSYYIHGWCFPHLAQQRTQGKLKLGTSDVKIEGGKCKYTGELNEKDEAHGQGTAVDESGNKFTGTFFNNKLHGIGR